MCPIPSGLWFDVEKKKDTTDEAFLQRLQQLWFDVEKKKDTTAARMYHVPVELWFDVEKKKDTTLYVIGIKRFS